MLTLGRKFVSREQLLEGAWYALEQASILLESAVALYDARQWSTAVGVGMLAREELGRFDILRDLASEAATTNVTVADVRAKSENHEKKQAKGIRSHVFKSSRDSALGRAIIAKTHHHPASAEAQAASEVLDAAAKAQRRQLPQKRHEMRMQAFYVDIQDSGEWKRPIRITGAVAHEVLEQAVNDYSVLFHNLGIDEWAPELTRVKKSMAPPPQLLPPRWPAGITEAEQGTA
jgi:AbiV family abortive infection protein